MSSVPGLSVEIAQCRLSRVRLQIEKSEKILLSYGQVYN